MGIAMTNWQQRLRAMAEFLVLAVCTVTFAFTAMGIFASMFGSGAAGSRDFVEYWASGHQLVHHRNPYDSEAILKLERSAGFPSGVPTLVMGNPPSALLLVLPLGVLNPLAGELLWELLLLASLVTSVRLVWIMQGQQKNLLHLLGYSFAPALSCLLAGQARGGASFGHRLAQRPDQAGRIAGRGAGVPPSLKYWRRQEITV